MAYTNISGISILCVMLIICLICLVTGIVNRYRGKKLELEMFGPGTSMLRSVALENLTEKKKFARVLDYYRRAADYCVYGFWFQVFSVLIVIATVVDNYLFS